MFLVIKGSSTTKKTYPGKKKTCVVISLIVKPSMHSSAKINDEKNYVNWPRHLIIVINLRETILHYQLSTV